MKVSIPFVPFFTVLKFQPNAPNHCSVCEPKITEPSFNRQIIPLSDGLVGFEGRVGEIPFWRKEVIGYGGCGLVYSVLPKDEVRGVLKGTSVAIKEFILSADDRSWLEAEVCGLKKFEGNKYVQRIYEWGVNEKNIGYIVSELAKGNMNQYISENKLSLKRKIKIVRGVVNAIISLHKNGVVHLDLKWSNVFYYDKNAEIIKIGDLGLAQGDNMVTRCAGTLE